MRRKILSSLLALTMVLLLTPAASAASLDNFKKVNSYTQGQFTDVAANAWYAQTVRSTWEQGLFQGNSATTFNPTGEITLAETIALACRLHSIYHTGVCNLGGGTPWYQVYVDYAVANGIIFPGQYGRYDVAATRAQFVSILVKALNQEVYPAINSVAQGSIPDVPAAADYAAGVYLLYNAGVLTGRDAKGSFSPQSTIQRSEAATIVARMANPSLRVTFSLGGADSGRVLVSQALEEDPLDYTVTRDSVVIQDLRDFCGTGLTYHNASVGSTYTDRKFEGTAEDKAILEEYVAVLTGGGYNLELVAEYDQTYTTTFFSWGLDYTGTGDVTSKKGVTFAKTSANICIWGTIERGKLEATVEIPTQMKQVDLGLRYDSPSVSTGIAGPSALAGLYRNGDGSFETSDGRLKTQLGQAAVLRDGVAYSAGATFQADQGNARDKLWVDSYYRNESFFFCTPMDAVMTGDIYTLKDLAQEESWIINWDFTAANQFDDFRWQLFFGAGHDGDFITPVVGSRNEFQDLTVRIMYWNPGVEGVYYIYAEYDTKPYAVEALVAVDLTAAPAGSDSQGSTTPSGSGSSGSSSSSDSDSDRPVQIRCTFVGCSDGKVECSACDGEGGRQVYDNSTPQYDGVGSNTDKWDWETCYKCHGSGEVDCSRCGGTGWIEFK
ncbi:S-layer homology domain-containing protein [Pseudoflavonifractor phocaeensis]|uniref:S-layer homology domain-containing protein n=1 Tax=Pseudoflavonifractor phocaeensis TaxID=1870988 RepID=UPI00195B4517|nr:S-layer homology domain-containing protein [Pseudoflavonifractor phocaeensis]MBM6925258.1 S-layer homology domain-containing protein [Pseudoflavonifractor phocaeensis]